MNFATSYFVRSSLLIEITWDRVNFHFKTLKFDTPKLQKYLLSSASHTNLNIKVHVTRDIQLILRSRIWINTVFWYLGCKISWHEKVTSLIVRSVGVLSIAHDNNVCLRVLSHKVYFIFVIHDYLFIKFLRKFTKL